jgi:hypothetical protein
VVDLEARGGPVGKRAFSGMRATYYAVSLFKPFGRMPIPRLDLANETKHGHGWNMTDLSFFLSTLYGVLR